MLSNPLRDKSWSNAITHTLFLLALLACATQADAAGLFADHAVLDVRLSGPLAATIAADDERAEQPFVWEANGVEHRVKVRARGKSRLRVCDFPPLRINFSSADTGQTVFEGQDKLKMVTHCRKGDTAQGDALQEYAAYRIFGVLSEVGYRVRLLRMTYVDTDQPGESLQRYAFVIEAQTDLARRVGGTPAHVSGVSLSSLDDEHMATVYVFQYLIGNTDWSLVVADGDDACCHNGDILDIGAKRYFVPYDFDLSGLVNARYAHPDPSLRIRKVTKRLYRGFCMPQETLRSGLDRVKNRAQEITRVITDMPGLAEKDARASQRYLARFFVEADDEDKILRSFDRRCL